MGGLEGILGPKSLKMSATGDLNDPFGPQIGGENQSKIHPEAIEKVIVFVDHFWDRLLERFGANLASKTFPKWSQVVPKSVQVEVLI